MKTRILIKDGEYKLAKAGVMDAKIDAEELYCYVTGMDKVTIFLKANEEVDPETEEQYQKLIECRATRVPLQHITGKQDFMGFTFKVGPEVLIPRQDTETLVTEAARKLQEMAKDGTGETRRLFGRLMGKGSLDVLDLCCGSGAVGISLAKICTDLNVVATDISGAAIDLAEINAEALRAKVKFLQGDLFDALDDKSCKSRKFDMIVSNPPYIRSGMIAVLQEEVKNHEPLLALDGGRSGLDFYEKIVSQAPEFMKPGGWLMMEIGHDQGEDLRKMIRDDGRYTAAEIVKDLPGRDRVVKCQLK